MNIKIRKETIKPMLELCKLNREGNVDHKEIERSLDKLLLHEDYRTELERYECAGGPRGSFTISDYKNIFFNYKTLAAKDIENERMRAKLKPFKDFMNDFDDYLDSINKLCDIDNEKIIKAIDWTLYGLPRSVELKDIEIILSISLGPSGAWAYKDYSYYDIVNFTKNYDEEVFLNTIAHELHHIGLSKLIPDEKLEKITLEELFLIALSGEGLATKFCNNYEGILTKSIYEIRVNKGIDQYSYNYFLKEFDNVYTMFKNDLRDIRNGVYKNTNELMKMIIEHWMTLKSSWNTDEKLDDLALSMNYFVGAEIWGLVHDMLGVEEVFKCLEHPQYFIDSYNKALHTIGRDDLII